MKILIKLIEFESCSESFLLMVRSEFIIYYFCASINFMCYVRFGIWQYVKLMTFLKEVLHQHQH